MAAPLNPPPTATRTSKRKPTRAKAAAESAGITLAVITLLVLVGVLLDYGAPGLFGGDDEPPAAHAGSPP